jgi:hypothetical protein
MADGTEGLFAGTEEFPNSDAQARMAALVAARKRSTVTRCRGCSPSSPTGPAS